MSDGQTSVVIGLDRLVPEPNTDWDIDAAPAGTSATVTIPLGGGETKSIRATLPSDTITELTGYFRFDKPPKTDPITYFLDQDNTSAEQAVDPSAGAPWKPPARRFLDAHREVLSRISPKTITIEGTASFDGDLPESRLQLSSQSTALAGFGSVDQRRCVADRVLPSATSRRPFQRVPSRRVRGRPIG